MNTYKKNMARIKLTCFRAMYITKAPPPPFIIAIDLITITKLKIATQSIAFLRCICKIHCSVSTCY